MLKFDDKIIAWHTNKPNKELTLKLRKIASLVGSLELNYVESQRNDRLLLTALRIESIKKDSLQKQLDKEEQQTMDIDRAREAERPITPSNDLRPSVSTVSLVHLQYKYEELLATHRGLLKIMEARNDEVKGYLEENRKLQESLQKANFEIGTAQDRIQFLQRKLEDLKRRKHDKIARLKAEKQTLGLVHRRLVALLHRQCMEKNDFIESLLKTTTRSEKGLLLQEIRKNNILKYENFQLQQQVEYLRSLLNLSRTSSKETIQTSRG